MTEWPKDFELYRPEGHFEQTIEVKTVHLMNGSIKIARPITRFVEHPLASPLEEVFSSGGRCYDRTSTGLMHDVFNTFGAPPKNPDELFSTAMSGKAMEILDKEFNSLMDIRKDRLTAAFAFWLPSPTMSGSQQYKRAVIIEHTNDLPKLVHVYGDLSNFPNFSNISIRYPFGQEIFNLLMFVLVAILYGVIAWIIG